MREPRTEWHRWFAWFPVNDIRMKTKWLQFVERRWDTGEETGDPEWRYRLAVSSSRPERSERHMRRSQ